VRQQVSTSVFEEVRAVIEIMFRLARTATGMVAHQRCINAAPAAQFSSSSFDAGAERRHAVLPGENGRQRGPQDERARVVRKLSRTSADISSLFSAIDRTGAGTISREDFEASMRTIGLDELRSLQQSLQRNELSRQPSRISKTLSRAIVEADVVPESERTSFPQMLATRTSATLEVMVSKIFPAGFGWQTASIIAEGQLGLAGDSAAFALATGIGDGLGVFLGHSGYYAAKRALARDDTIDVETQIHTGVLLGTAALCSGTAWQPLVNFLQGAGCSFNQTAVGVVVGCGLAFFGGLRAGRFALSGSLHGVELPSYGNLKADAALSVSIGGATGAFVGTDVSFAAGENWLRPVVGVEEGMSNLAGCLTAGASTSIGFTAFQTAQNVAYDQGKSWVD
jgi:hypothetical protein